MGKPIGFIGAGQMARALAKGFIAGGQAAADDLIAYDPIDAALDEFRSLVSGARAASGNRQVVEDASVIFLAVKPQHVDGVMEEIAAAVNDERLIVSIVAGVSLRTLVRGLGSERVIRVMPNTPCLLGVGASAYALGDGATAEDGRLVGDLLGAVGYAVQVDEHLLDAVTGLSGSGPAYGYQAIEALSDGGVRVGLPRAIATRLAAQTLLGAAQMVLETGEHPGVLKDRVASPGGTTIAGLQALEDHGFRAALISAVQAATARATELGRDAESE